MKKQILITLGCLCAIISPLIAAETADTPPTSPRANFNFNPGWKLFVGDDTNAAAAGFDDLAW